MAERRRCVAGGGGGELVGIFSLGDYARARSSSTVASRDTPVRGIMTPNVVTVTPDQDLSDCMRIMTDKRNRHLPSWTGAAGRVLSIGDDEGRAGRAEFLIGQLSDYIGGVTV